MERSIPFRIIVTSDSHIGKKPERISVFRRTMISMLSEKPDLIIHCGDITHNGTWTEMDEAANVFNLATQNGVPIVLGPGNHDHQGYIWSQSREYFENKGIIVLDGNVYSLKKGKRVVEITGVEGYGESYDQKMPATHYFDRVSQPNSTITDDDLERLTTGLSLLRGDINLVELHFNPGVEGTLKGEKEKYYPIFGSRRFASLVDEHNENSQYKVGAIVHGHADHGSHEGVTPGGIPVYNVSMYVLEKYVPHNEAPKLYRIIEI